MQLPSGGIGLDLQSDVRFEEGAHIVQRPRKQDVAQGIGRRIRYVGSWIDGSRQDVAAAAAGQQQLLTRIGHAIQQHGARSLPGGKDGRGQPSRACAYNSNVI